MNKLNHRLEGSNQISKIQQSLKEMKLEVEGFLKRHKKDIVPPILKGRHYLLLDSINRIGTIQPIQSPSKLIKDLSSEALCSVSQTDNLNSLRRLHLQKKKTNTIVKQKRTISGINHYQNKRLPEQSCLLPNICNLRMDDDHLSGSLSHRRPLRDQSSSNEDSKEKAERIFNEAKRYRSIDLYSQSYLSEMQPEATRETLRGSKLKWLQKSFSKHLYQNSQQANHLGNVDSLITSSDANLQKQDRKIKTIEPDAFPNAVLENVNMELLERTQDNHLNVRKSIYKKIGRQLSKLLPVKHTLNNKLTIRLPKQNKKAQIELARFDPWQNEEDQASQKLFFNEDLQ